MFAQGGDSMHDEWREIIATAMESEAEKILDEVNAEPSLKDVQVPEDIHDKLFEQIRDYEKQKIYDQLTEEDRELIQLGKVYKKKRKIGRYVAVAMAVVAALALGNVSMGEGQDILNVVSEFFAGREQTVAITGDADTNIFNEEAEIYEKIEEIYGFSPVRLEYLPQYIVYQEAVLGEEIQSANLIYGTNKQAKIIYIIKPNYRENSFGTDIEDHKIQRYQMLLDEVEITITEYVVEESDDHKWTVQFIYKDVFYLLRITDVEQEEVEKIVNNLHFFG